MNLSNTSLITLKLLSENEIVNIEEAAVSVNLKVQQIRNSINVLREKGFSIKLVDPKTESLLSVPREFLIEVGKALR